MADKLPEQIGPYVVIDRLGAGGMAEVFLVQRPGLQGTFRRQMALKRILTAHAQNSDLRAQFREETRIMGGLHHPNIVSALDSGEVDDSYYLVMEFISGATLSKVFRHLRKENARLPVSLAIHILRKLLSALELAHGAPHFVIHRDLSPHNILLSHLGEVKLADFGISRFAGRDHQTRTDSLLKGKLAYMSPEQISTPRDIDARSDFFALGIVAYEMLSGTHPFVARGERVEEQQVMLRIVNGPPVTPLHGLGLEPELVTLVSSLLERDPKRRPDNAREALRILDPLPPRRDPERLLGTYVLQSLGQAPEPEVVIVDRTPVPDPKMVTVERLEFRDSVELELEDRPSREPSGWVLPDEQGSASMAQSRARPEARVAPSWPASVPLTASAPLADASTKLRRRRLPLVAALALGAGGLVAAFAFTPSSPAARVAASANTNQVPQTAPTSPAPTTAASPPDALLLPIPTPTQPGARTEATTPAPQSDSAPARSEASEPASGHGRSSRRRGASTLHVTVLPWGEVWLDGKRVGQSPLELTGLDAGRHRLQIGQGEPQQEHIVQLKPGPNPFEYVLR